MQQHQSVFEKKSDFHVKTQVYEPKSDFEANIVKDPISPPELITVGMVIEHVINEVKQEDGANQRFDKY